MVSRVITRGASGGADSMKARASGLIDEGGGSRRWVMWRSR